MSDVATVLPTSAEMASGPSSSVVLDSPGKDFTVILVRDPRDLAGHLPAWHRLVEVALEPNVFYEPLMLLPALEMLAEDDGVELALIYAPRRKAASGPPVLCGIFPLAKRRSYYGLPVASVQMWQYLHCFLCTPIVRADCAPGVIAALFDWFEADNDGARLIQFRKLGAGGPLHHVLVNLMHDRQLAFWLTRRHTRAFFSPAVDADTYLDEAMPRKRQSELRRLERRLKERGTLEHRMLSEADDLETWLDDFLTLESNGWKGRNDTALACRRQDIDFFRNVAGEAFRAGRLTMQSLRLDGRPIAMKCDLRAGQGAFGFKIAYDERFEHYSPGVLLELHNLALVHETGEPAWIDSCASADHAMINRLWYGRREIESLWVATGRSGGDLLVSMSPLLKWIERSVRQLFPARSNGTHPDSPTMRSANGSQ